MITKKDARDDGEIALAGFPTLGSGTWDLSREHLLRLQEAYPDTDVLGEARRARQWCRDNEKRRKTPKGMPRFINAWMARQDAPLVAAPSRGLPTIETIGRVFEGSLDGKQR